jgi:hypothetical protein
MLACWVARALTALRLARSVGRQNERLSGVRGRNTNSRDDRQRARGGAGLPMPGGAVDNWDLDWQGSLGPLAAINSR